MRTNSLCCVIDTNILVDLHHGLIAKEVFTLSYTFLVPDVIIAEMKHPPGTDFLSYGLQEHQLSGNDMQGLSVLQQRYPQPSFNDLLALRLAQIEGATLLTGDKHLRRAAEQEGVPVHGLLWLLDIMIEEAVIVPMQAANALRSILTDPTCRLPQTECQQRLQRWQSG